MIYALWLLGVVWLVVLSCCMRKKRPRRKKKGLVERAAVCAFQGRRQSMEDAHVCIPDAREYKTTAFFAVYDGHGGARASTFAAEHLHTLILSNNHKQYDPVRAIFEGFETFENQWLEHSRLEDISDGSTAIIVWIIHNVMYIANLGDSRAVLGTGGRAVALSKDHKPGDPVERKRIEALGGFVMMNCGALRVQGELATSRALGDVHLKPYVGAKPDIRPRHIGENDDFLIIASDGLWDVVKPQEAVDLVSRQPGVSTAAPALVEMAMSLNTNDNVTVIVVDLKAYRHELRKFEY
mmetsp:Transcript_16606/g.26325  ORF Transcript_16606/g.26325 Transcript_16606/m.26325 type:complete len:295 (-) Transcript_16606:72-956(-)